jgi:hypothetical protein
MSIATAFDHFSTRIQTVWQTEPAALAASISSLTTIRGEIISQTLASSLSSSSPFSSEVSTSTSATQSVVVVQLTTLGEDLLAWNAFWDGLTPDGYNMLNRQTWIFWLFRTI